MEGIWFYWIGWIGWVITTFIVGKGKVRTQVAILILVLLSFAHMKISILSHEISIGFLILLFVSYMMSAKLNNITLLYISICTIILGLAYVTFYLFSLFDPVWIVFNPTFMVSFILTYLVLLLTKQSLKRYIIFIIGICHGEVLYRVILSKIQFTQTIGTLLFFDIVAIGIFMISLWNGLELLSTYFNQLQQKQARERLG
ncbi:hypothetical protein ACFSCX_18765 [Bacillus salitolerans]|uniref:Uncharacterized protein n=1 Tax=Bacillus salitolerans TaxID=1437434 RepID=A0ABW4LTR7_9BACI